MAREEVSEFSVAPELRAVRDAPQTREPTMAAGLGRPFVEELASRNLLPDWMVKEAMRTDPEDRLSVRAGLHMLANATAISGDPDLGLHAAMRNSIAPQLVEYVAASCPTIGDAFAALERYVTVVNESLSVRVRVEGEVAIVAIRELVPSHRTSADYVVASIYLRCLEWGSEGARGEIETWFAYPKPPDTRAHDMVFGAGHVRFDAPHHALCFPAQGLDEPLGSADPRLNEILVRSVKDRLAGLASRQGLAQRVRALVWQSPDGYGLQAQLVADRLDMSLRTLTRRLESEGTTFRVLLEEARCAETLRCLVGERLSVRETARRVGFSDPTAFYKAFRRWFGMTPKEYVERHGTPAR